MKELCISAADVDHHLGHGDFVPLMFWPDLDGDGFGDLSAPGESGCVVRAGFVEDDTDCEDTSPEINPDAPEVCDGVDNNCNGEVDEGGLCEPGVLGFSAPSYEVQEDTGVAIVTVERVGGAAGAISVDYSTFDGSAVDGEDYTGVTGTLTWFDGDAGSRTFVVPILDDAEAEGAETIDLLLMHPTGGATLDPAASTAVIVIPENDGGGPGVLGFSASSYEVQEDAGLAIVTVERVGGAAGEISVDYSTFGGSAGDGVDYIGVTGTLTWFDGGAGSRTFAVPILDDAEAEGEETIDLLLINPTGGATLDPSAGVALVTILDNDSSP